MVDNDELTLRLNTWTALKTWATQEILAAFPDTTTDQGWWELQCQYVKIRFKKDKYGYSAGRTYLHSGTLKVELECRLPRTYHKTFSIPTQDQKLFTQKVLTRITGLNAKANAYVVAREADGRKEDESRRRLKEACPNLPHEFFIVPYLNEKYRLEFHACLSLEDVQAVVAAIRTAIPAHKSAA